MDLNHSILETLRSGQHCKVTRNDITTGIFDCPKLLYASDGEEDDNLPNAQEENRQHEVQGPGLLDQPFQSLEQFNLQFQHSANKVRCLMALSDEGNPLLKDGDDMALPETLSNVEWVEFLVKKGPDILTAAPKNPVQTCRILRKLGSAIQVLRPGSSADGDMGDWRDRSLWQRQLSALASELMMVEVGCSSEVRDSGVFVLTTFEYPALLEMMAQEILQTFGVA